MRKMLAVGGEWGGGKMILQHLIHEYAVLVVVGLYVGVDVRLHLLRKAFAQRRDAMMEWGGE